MPRSIGVNPATMAVSVFVSPRLNGSEKLGDFGDWVSWTRRLATKGLNLKLQCGANTRTFAIDRNPLRPDLWEQLFNAETFVRSHETFDDYSDRALISFSMRGAFSALKSIYREASVSLALPDRKLFGQRQEIGNVSRLRQLVDGLQVHWDARAARDWREGVRLTKSSRGYPGTQPVAGQLDSEGAITDAPNANAFHSVAMPFAVYHHMPAPPKYQELKIKNKDRLIDFHQALSSLNSYPELLRALGIVFDLELPRDFVPLTSATLGTISVQKAVPGWQWAIAPKSYPLATAYVNVQVGQQRYFFTAPRAMSDPEAPPMVIGLLNLDPQHFGLAQVDVDGAMHKAIMLAETLHPSGDHNVEPTAQPEAAPHPEVFDPEATLPSLRSGGFSLFADNRALQLLATIQQSKAFNDAVGGNKAQPRLFFAEDLVRGYRLDVWDSRTETWHSLHLREAKYRIGDVAFAPKTEPEEGFMQLAATQPPPGAKPPTNDLYLHEAIARWTGWSLSAPRPGKHLSRYPNAKDAIPDDNDPDKFAEDQPETPFKITAKYQAAKNSLPQLRFGRRYRFRARAVDIAGNSLACDAALADGLALISALPRDPDGFAYLRFEPVPAPLAVIRNAKAVTDPGSAVDRLVIRTFNDALEKDTDAADTTAADRHIVPPRASIEMGERLGTFDDSTGKLSGDTATWKLIAKRDKGELNSKTIEIAGGAKKKYPLESAARIDELPYFPDPLSRGAAIRDLPGTPSGALGKVVPDAGVADSVDYQNLNDPNPRPGSATLISFGETGDWEQTHGFRFVVADPSPKQEDLRPNWDPIKRILTVYLPKGQMRVVPLTSYTSVSDLKLMGVWQWMREYIDEITLTQVNAQRLVPGSDLDRIAHVLQRSVEGGHWMLTPPYLLTLVHAVQQPIGRPEFTALNVSHQDAAWDPAPLQTAPDRGRQDPTELAAITAWRRFGATDAYLLGALKVHGASTAKIDLTATWEDPVDDISQPKWSVTKHAAPVDELPLPEIFEDYLYAPGKDNRTVGYYDPEHDQIAFVRAGDTPTKDQTQFSNAAPRHLLNDTKRHIVNYTATAASRFREYFDQSLDFTRISEPVTVDVPASARPLAPDVVYVIPTFGWERQTDTNLKRSVRFGGGLRVYLRRPWFSSGEGELLGVALWSYANGSLDKVNRDKFKPFFTQWGMDPIWRTDNLGGAPDIYNFVGYDEFDCNVSLEETSVRDAQEKPGRISVVGFGPQFDKTRGLWFADLTINVPSETYMPFVRLALVRYQPHALADAKVSRVVLADFAQLTPDRSAMVTSDPHHAKTIRVVVSGVAPRGPDPVFHGQPADKFGVHRPTQIRVRVQQRDEALASDLAWNDVPPTVAKVTADFDDFVQNQPNLALWAGSISFAKTPEVSRYRLLIEEYEYVSANFTLGRGRAPEPPGRLIYAEIFELDDALISET